MLGFAGEVDAGDVGGAGCGFGLAGVVAEELGALELADEAGLAGDGLEQVLGAEERVGLAEALALLVDEGGVVGVDLGQGLVVVLEVAADAVVLLGVFVDGDLVFEQGVAGPGGAVEDGGGVGGGGHGAEVFVVLGGVEVLGLVDLEGEGGGEADDVGAGVAGEEEDAGLAEADDVAVLLMPVGAVERVVEGGEQAQLAS